MSHPHPCGAQGGDALGGVGLHRRSPAECRADQGVDRTKIVAVAVEVHTGTADGRVTGLEHGLAPSVMWPGPHTTTTDPEPTEAGGAGGAGCLCESLKSPENPEAISLHKIRT